MICALKCVAIVTARSDLPPAVGPSIRTMRLWGFCVVLVVMYKGLWGGCDFDVDVACAWAVELGEVD